MSSAARGSGARRCARADRWYHAAPRATTRPFATTCAGRAAVMCDVRTIIDDI
jgi:hypothetical protein